MWFTAIKALLGPTAQWINIFSIILQIILEYMKGKEAAKNGDDKIAKETLEKRIQLYGVIAKRSSGRASRLAADRHRKLVSTFESLDASGVHNIKPSG